MNIKDIRTSSDTDLIGSCAAIQRAARSAQDLAIRTNTHLIVRVDGVDRRLTPKELLEIRAEDAALGK